MKRLGDVIDDIQKRMEKVRLGSGTRVIVNLYQEGTISRSRAVSMLMMRYISREEAEQMLDRRN